MPSLEDYLSGGYDYLRVPSYGVSAGFISSPPVKPTPKPDPFKVGDKVKVNIQVVATVEDAWGSTVDIALNDDDTIEGIPHKFVTLVAPENWPPKAGQVWKADGKMWGVRQHTYRPLKTTVYQVDNISNSYSDAVTSGRSLDAFKALRPVLVG